MYSIEFMNDEEFERLPYRDMGDKIGVCDRNRNKVYVRKSGAPIMDSLTAMHEIEHMEEGDWGKHANHQDPEKKGIYYKNFGNVAQSIMPILGNMLFPGLGGVAGSAMADAVWKPGGLSSKVGLPSAQGQKAPDSTNYGGGNVMQSFQPQAQQPQSSVINPGGAGGQGGSGVPSGPMGMGQDLIQKIRGQFGGQTPQQGSLSFGSGNTEFRGA